MRILFIRPNATGVRSIPIGLTLLQAIARNAGHETKVFDTTFLSETVASFDKALEDLGFFKPTDISRYIKVKHCNIEETLINELKSFQPDLAAFSLMSNDIHLSLSLANSVRKFNKDIPILFGGIHPTVAPENTIKEDCVDMLCIGESEEAFAELINKMSRNDDITNIKNIWVKQKGEVFKNPLRPFLNMDTLPPPDFTGFSQMHLYRPFWGKVYRVVDVETSRGCPCICSECINVHLREIYKEHKHKYTREKSIEKTISDLKHVKENCKPEIFRFIDEILCPSGMKRLKEFSRLYKKEINLPFVAYGRIGFLTEEMIETYKEMGCISLSIGIESGNEHMRNKILARPMKNEKIVDTFRMCNKYRIRTTAFNLIALPEEGRKEIFDTIEVNRQADPGLTSVAFVYPFHGTPLRKYCLEKGYIKEDDPLVDYDQDTIIRNDKITKKEQLGLHKTFVLYVLSPKWMFPLIRICELDNPISNWIHKKLVKHFRDNNFKKNDQRYEELEDNRNISLLDSPPLEDF